MYHFTIKKSNTIFLTIHKRYFLNEYVHIRYGLLLKVHFFMFWVHFHKWPSASGSTTKTAVWEGQKIGLMNRALLFHKVPWKIWLLIYSASQKKQKPETMECCEQIFGCMTIITYIFHEVWSICFRMIHCSNSSSHAPLSSIVLIIEFQNPFVPLYGRQENGYIRNPMWPSLG